MYSFIYLPFGFINKIIWFCPKPESVSFVISLRDVSMNGLEVNIQFIGNF